MDVASSLSPIVAATSSSDVTVMMKDICRCQYLGYHHQGWMWGRFGVENIVQLSVELQELCKCCKWPDCTHHSDGARQLTGQSTDPNFFHVSASVHALPNSPCNGEAKVTNMETGIM